MGFGICIVALGHQLYGSYALNLAMSLKCYDQGVKIALLCDPEALMHLSEEEKEFFDEFIFIPKEDFTFNGKPHYMRVKLMVNRYTPFDRTIYLDADNIWLDKKISWLFGELFDKKFWIGYNTQFDVKNQRSGKHGYTYWCRDEMECCKYHKIQNVLPQTVSGFYYFQKCFETDIIFETALKIYDDPKAPCDPFAGQRPDEYCFNVALGHLNKTQPEYNPIYFDKLHGALEGAEIYSKYWAIAVGGNRVSKAVKGYYDKLVTKYCAMSGIRRRHLYSEEAEIVLLDKVKVIPERLTTSQ